MKVVTFVGTRPEIIKVSATVRCLDKQFEHTLVHTGQNYDRQLKDVFLEELGMPKVEYYLDAAGDSGVETMANVLSSSYRVLQEISPDAFLCLGDTNSCMALLSAKRLKIPTFHMEAGNRCFDDRVPEEIIRRIVDHTADINLPYTQIAKDYLIREGLNPYNIVTTGSPMREVLNSYTEKIAKSVILETLNLELNDYILASIHREENVDSTKEFLQIIKLLEEIGEQRDVDIILSTHPRTRKKIRELGVQTKQIRYIEPLGFIDYIALMKSALVTISDSGTITEESHILKTKAISIRQSHERPEGMEASVLPIIEPNAKLLENAIKLVLNNDVNNSSVDDYEDTNVADKVANTILSYTHYVNRSTWKK